MSLSTKKYSSSVEIQGDSEIQVIKYTIPKDTIIYTIPDNPTAWARAVPLRNRHTMWDSQKQLKLYLGLLIGKSHGNRQLYEGPLLLDVKFCMPMTQKMLKTPEMWEDMWYDQRPDIDNLSKLIMDTCNEILYEDDKLISLAITNKVYSAIPRTEFRIIELR